MRLTFRAKLMTIVGTAAVAFVLLIVAGAVISAQVDRQLVALSQRYVPLVELEPRMSGQLDRLSRLFQDAVAARDTDALATSSKLESELLAELDAAAGAVDPQAAATLRSTLDDYVHAASDVSHRIIAGETGEGLVLAISEMQAKQAHVATMLKQTTAFDRRDLADAFAKVSQSEVYANRIELIISLVCLVVVLTLSLVLSRGVLRSMTALTEGFHRFGAGDFRSPISVPAGDELSQLAERANQMAVSLQRQEEDRARADWLKGGLAGMVAEIRGDLEPAEVAARALAFLARYLEAPAGALYLRATATDRLELAGAVAAPHELPSSFRLGEGLVGQAALSPELTVLADPPGDYLRIRSGLGEGTPRAIALAPLLRAGHVQGVIELAFFKPWAPLSGELLLSVRETLAIALEGAVARRATRELLAQTQTQAQQLATQEEELRAMNEELKVQQEELQQGNVELAQQAHVLELQGQTLEKSNADLEGARRDLEKKASDLATVSAYKSQFLANMSHELRTPLNSMLLLSNLLSENDAGTLSEKQVQYAKTIYGAGNDLLALINQVLDLAKIEAGKQDLHLASMRLRHLIDYAKRTFEPVAVHKGLTFAAELEPGLPEELVTDARRTEQVINNLLGNAIKFTSKGQVVLRIFRPVTRPAREGLAIDQAIALSVTDTGPGIAPEHHQRIFAPFEQVEGASDRHFGGTGLGLSIAKEIAELLGGELQLQSQPGQGSTFTLLLPMRPPAEVSDGALGEESHVEAVVVSSARPASRTSASVREGARPTLLSSAAVGDLHLLLIEDEPVFAEAFADVIRSQGVECRVAGDGLTGLRYARERRPAGIVLDVKLPEMDGWQVMDRLKADPVTADIPVYFVSAVNGRERGMAMRAVGYLTKPAVRDDLVQVVQSLVPQRAARRCRILIVEFDPQAGRWLLEHLRKESFDAQLVSTAAGAVEALSGRPYDCVVLDPAHPEMVGLNLLHTLESIGREMPSVVVYTNRALTKAEATRLDAYAEAVVLKEGASGERLLDEIRLFARRLREGRGPRPARGPTGPSIRLDRQRILVVEDDMRTAFALSATLRAKGAEVLLADTGKVALDTLSEQPNVDAVLMDIMMPDMDGYEAMRRIRQDARFRTLPIIALTAKAMKGDDQRSLEAGATQYLAKPIDPDRLLTMLSACLTGTRHAT